MVLLSTLRQRCPSLNLSRLLKLNPQPGVIQKRHGGHHNFEIKPSNFNFKKSKDLIHFYTCVAILLYGPFIFYFNVFQGEAILREIPEGYKPEHWEYYKHPVTRWLQRRFEDPQKNYEKFLHFLYEEDEQQKMRLLDKEVDKVMKRRKDYEAHYYAPVTVVPNAVREDAETVGDQYHYLPVDTISSAGFPTDIHDDEDARAAEFAEFSGDVKP